MNHAISPARVAATAVALLLTTGALAACGTTGATTCDLVSAPEHGREAYPVTVFTNDLPAGEALLEDVRARGYVHEEGEVLEGPNETFNVKWGGAPLAYVLELAQMVEERYGRQPRLLNIFGRGDDDIFLNVPFGAPPEEDASVGDLDRAAVHLVVFSRDPAIGARLLERLQGMGYTNPDNAVQGQPNPEFNVKWGAAPRALVDEIVTVLEETFRTPFRLRHEFGEDDPDLFINLPVEGI